MKTYRPFISKIILSAIAIIMGVVIMFNTSTNIIWAIIGIGLFISVIFTVFERNKIVIDSGVIKMIYYDSNGNENTFEIKAENVNELRFDGNFVCIVGSDGVKAKINVGWYSNKQIDSVICELRKYSLNNTSV
jgi:hypothetical protein